MAIGELVAQLLLETGSFETDTKRAADTVVKLQKLVKQLNDVIAESHSNSADFMGPLQPSRMRPAIDGVDRLNRSVQQSQSGFRSANQVIQNTSYQVTDFVVQISGGVSAMRAFSQQAPQFLGAFGGVGAVLGIVAALGGAIADLVMKMNTAKTGSELFKELGDRTKNLEEATRSVSKIDLSDLGKNYREASVQGKSLIAANIGLQISLLELSRIDATKTFRDGIHDSLKEIGTFTRGLYIVKDIFDVMTFQKPGGLRDFNDEFSRIAGTSKEVSESLDAAKKKFGETGNAADYVKELNKALHNTKEVTPVLQQYVQKESERANQIQVTNDKLKALTAAQNNHFQGLEKGSKEGENFIRALRERTTRTEEGEIAMLRFQASLKGVSAEAEPLINKLRDANWDKGFVKFNETLVASTEQLRFQASLIGKSALETELLNTQYKIEADLLKAKQDLIRQNGEISQSASDKMDAAAKTEIANQQAIINARHATSRSADFGMKSFYDSYTENATNAAKNTEMVFSRAFDGMADALATFTMTGKLDFNSLANSIVADITRIVIKQQLMMAFGAATNNGTSGTGMFGWLMGSMSSGASSSGGMSASSISSSFGASQPMFSNASLSSIPKFGSFDIGGFTGNAPKDKPTGIVHGGEFVFTKEATSRIGVGALYRMMRGYSNGGLVSNSNNAAQFRAGQSVIVHVTPPVGSSRQSAQQWGAEAGKTISRSMARNG